MNFNIHWLWRVLVISAISLNVMGCGGSGGGDSPLVVDSELDRFNQDLGFITAAPRAPGSPHHRAVQTMCADRFESLGFEVVRTLSEQIQVSLMGD